MNKSKLIYEVREAIRAYSNDAKTTNEYILHVIDVTRAKYIRQHQTRNIGEDKVGFTQTLFLDLERVDKSYTPIAPYLINENILRTVKALPRIIGKSILKNIEVRPIDRISTEIEFMDKARAMFISGAEPGFIYSFLDDDMHLYFVGKDNLHEFLQRAAVTAILEVPTDIVATNELTEELEDYPLPEHLWSLMKPEVLEAMGRTLQIPIDDKDDNQTVQ